MISHGVEISMAGGVGEKLRGPNYSDFCSFFLLFFFFKLYVYCSYGTRNDMHLIDMAKTKPEIKQQSTKEIFVTSSSKATNMCRRISEAKERKV